MSKESLKMQGLKLRSPETPQKGDTTHRMFYSSQRLSCHARIITPEIPIAQVAIFLRIGTPGRWRNFMFKKKDRPNREGNFIDIEAGMTGDLKFTTPVNLKINGKFDGRLETEGVLIIGEKADVKVKIIKGEDIQIAGKVKGDIVSSKRLELFASAIVTGNVKAAILIINEGASLNGHCQAPIEEEISKHKEGLKSKKKRK